MKLSRCLPGFLLLPCLPLAAAELEDAARVIQQLQQSAESPANGEDDSPSARWKKALADYSAQSPSLPPDEAARQWLVLAKQWEKLSPSASHSYHHSSDNSFNSLIKVLPPPAVWEALQKQTAQAPLGDPLPDALLALLAATLVNDEAGKWKGLDSIRQIGGSPDPGSAILQSITRLMGGSNASDWMKSSIGQLADAFVETSDDPAHILAALEIQLQLRGKEKGASLTIPDLVTLAGEAKARAFLQKALALPLELNVRGIQTQALAREIAVRNPGSLAMPQWGLVAGIDESNLQLYAALAGKFPDSGESDYERRTAAGYYLLGLIAKGRTADASRFVLESKPGDLGLPYQGLKAMRAAGYGGAIYEFLHTLLEKNPDLPFWSDFLAVAAEERKTAGALELAQRALQRPQLTDAQRQQVLQELAHAYLAHGETAKGVALLRERIQLLKAAPSPDESEISRTAMEMVALGRLLPDSALREEGLKEA
ncbi:MAG TPA: hypothetical protein VIS74_01100, partial [Chthoniobacterales bacterium]